jgi:hypothetical protein
MKTCQYKKCEKVARFSTLGVTEDGGWRYLCAEHFDKAIVTLRRWKQEGYWADEIARWEKLNPGIL